MTASNWANPTLQVFVNCPHLWSKSNWIAHLIKNNAPYTTITLDCIIFSFSSKKPRPSWHRSTVGSSQETKMYLFINTNVRIGLDLLVSYFNLAINPWKWYHIILYIFWYLMFKNEKKVHFGSCVYQATTMLHTTLLFLLLLLDHINLWHASGTSKNKHKIKVKSEPNGQNHTKSNCRAQFLSSCTRFSQE